MTDGACDDPWQVQRLDLTAYLARLGVPARPPSPAALDELLVAHRTTFTFDNIDVLLEQHPGVSLPAIQEKFLGRGRGGYCFEHATIFAAALQRLGYAATRLLGRVGDSRHSPRTHLVVAVTLDQQPADNLGELPVRLLTDPGFGYTFTHPMALADGTEQLQEGEHFRIDRIDENGCATWALSRLRADRWELQHTTDELPVRPVDVEMSHHYTNALPTSHFRHRLILGKRHADGSHTTISQHSVVRRHPERPTAHTPFTVAALPGLLEELDVTLTPEELRRLTARVRALVG